MACGIPFNSVIPKDNNFLLRMSEQILEFWDYGLYTDVTFAWRCSPKRIKAHQIVLAASSVYFQTLFNVFPGDKKTIYIDTIYVSTFYDLVKYCYTGILDVNAINVEELLRGARIMRLKGATDICLRYINGQIALGQDERTPQTAPKISDINTTITKSPYIPYIVRNRNDNTQWSSLSKRKVSLSSTESVGTKKPWRPTGLEKNNYAQPKMPSAFSSFTFSPTISTDILNMFSSSKSVTSSNDTSSSNSSKNSISSIEDKLITNMKNAMLAQHYSVWD